MDPTFSSHTPCRFPWFRARARGRASRGGACSWAMAFEYKPLVSPRVARRGGMQQRGRVFFSLLLAARSLFVTPRAFLNRRGTESLGPPSSNLAGSIILDDWPERFGRRVGCRCTRGVRASLGAAEGQSARIAGFELPCLPTWIRVRGNLATCMHGVWGAGFYEGGELSWSWAACVRDFRDLKCPRALLLWAGRGCKHARVPHRRAPGRGVLQEEHAVLRSA